MASRNETKLRPRNRSRTGPGAPAPIDLNADDPLYLQLFHALKSEIVRGTYPVGATLPPEDELRKRYAVSRYTVREALRRLREDNLVRSRRGSGTTVVAPRPSESHVHEVTSINDLVTYAAGSRFAIETIELIEVDRKLAQQIGVAGGEAWLAARGYRYREGSQVPLCWTEVYINREFAAVGRLLQRHTGPIFHLIEDMYGQRIADVQQEISAARMTQAMADGLRVTGDPIALEVRRTYRLASGQIALIAINIHPASRFRHSMTMRRVKA